MFGFIGALIRPASLARGTIPAGRSCAIDFLRGIAILLVLGCHYAVAPSAAGFLEPVAGFFYRIGWAGVDLFFVLSGFLVSGLLFAEFKRNQRVDVGRFLVRRGFKIWPAYFAYLAVVGAWLFWQHRHLAVGADPGTSLWANLLHVQNYFGSPRVHTWSLAVEEHFYLAGAALAAGLLVTHRFERVRRVFPALALASLVAVAWWRYSGFVHGGRESLNLFATHLRFDGLLIGSLLAFFAHFEPRRLQGITRHPVLAIVGGLGLAMPMLLLTPDHNALTAGPGLTVMYLGFALVILGVTALELSSGRWRRVFASGPVSSIARIGFFSYGIYLWHLDLAQVSMKKVAHWALDAGLSGAVTWLCVTAIYVTAAAYVGALMSRLIEIPCLALRDRFFPSAAIAAKPAVASAGVTPPEAAVPQAAVTIA